MQSIYTQIKTLMLTCIAISILISDYSTVNAFPNLSFEDPVGIYHAGDGSNRIFILEQLQSPSIREKLFILMNLFLIQLHLYLTIMHPYLLHMS